MKVEIVRYIEDFITGEVEREIENGYIIAPGVAVVPCISTLYFVSVGPSEEGTGLYDDLGLLCDIILPSDNEIDLTTMPASALTFALWVAGKTLEPLATAV
ncbi:hypothetical protein [Paenibacillus sp. LPE1-1-1.1]|uniref:hypothetical protein n=1 Tax=Paenibacillus sp. LPE1-1-1.1 TaxID=3135230 RepID=UPI00341CC371